MWATVVLLKKTWGEGLTGNIAISLTSWGTVFLLIGLSMIGFTFVLFLDSIVIAAATETILLLCLMLMWIVTRALCQVFLAGLNEYAKTGVVPVGFTEDTMADALVKSQ